MLTTPFQILWKSLAYCPKALLEFFSSWFQCSSIPWDPSQASNVSQVALVCHVDPDKYREILLFFKVVTSFGSTTIEVVGEAFKTLICLKCKHIFFSIFLSQNVLYKCLLQFLEICCQNVCHFISLCCRELFLNA